MDISELITELLIAKIKYGDLPVYLEMENYCNEAIEVIPSTKDVVDRVKGAVVLQKDKKILTISDSIFNDYYNTNTN